MDASENIMYTVGIVLVVLGLIAGLSNVKARSEGTDWYSLIIKNPTKYRGTAEEGHGCIIQQIGHNEYLMNKYLMNKIYGDLFYIKLTGSALYVDVHQDDEVNYAGVLDGIYTYTTIRNETRTIPCIAVSYISVVPKKK